MEGSGSPGPEIATGVVPEPAADPVGTVVPGLDADPAVDPTTTVSPTVFSEPLATVEPDASSGSSVDAGAADAASAPETPPAEPPAERAEILDPRVDRVGRQKARALIIIKGAREQNVYDTQEKLDLATAAESSRAGDIKAVLASLKVAEGYASDNPVSLANIQEVYNDISQNVIVTSGGRTYNLSVLEAERVTASEARRVQIDAIIRGGEFRLSFDAGELIEGAVNQQIVSLGAKIAEAEKTGGDVRKEKEILGRLKGLTGGQARNAIAISSFRQLQSMGVTGLDQVIARGARLEAVSRAKIIETLRNNHYTDSQIENILMPQILNGNLQALVEGKVLEKPGVDLLFFERSLSDKELQERLALIYPVEAEALWKKHGKNAALAILILIAMGVVPSAKKMLLPD